jgi:aspartyl-tRNA(Asn)/glutamyl-tRNA(Gln) amidotransferase subunit B
VPELPGARAERFIREYGIPDYDAQVLTGQKELANYYEATVRAHKNPKAISNWIMTEILRLLSEQDAEVATLPVKADHLAGLVKLIDDQTINGKIAKEVFRFMLDGEGDPAGIVSKRGLAQMTDTSAIEGIVDEVLAANEASVADYKSGKDKALKHLMGQVMKASRGKANPALVQDLIKKKLA